MRKILYLVILSLYSCSLSNGTYWEEIKDIDKETVLGSSHLTLCCHRHLHILFFQLWIRSRFCSMILKPDMVQGKGY